MKHPERGVSNKYQMEEILITLSVAAMSRKEFEK
jgi:hypothetical protein